MSANTDGNPGGFEPFALISLKIFCGTHLELSVESLNHLTASNKIISMHFKFESLFLLVVPMGLTAVAFAVAAAAAAITCLASTEINNFGQRVMVASDQVS